MDGAQNSLGDRIKAAREARGLRQDQSAELAGLSQAYWSRVETGDKKDPRVSTIVKIAKALGVRVSTLIE